ncbi:MAG: retroviral-like aspartic protease family protein [Treponema sp.]|nr:retroviral-like aspartic protease family protein [Treponema sp.]
MGTVRAEITLVNVADKIYARSGYIKPEEVRAETVEAVVDTGSMSLVITEELRKKLGLAIQGDKMVSIANGQRVSCKLTEAVEIHWKNRISILSAVVIPGAKTVLLGAIPLEDMDLMVNPVTQELVGAHGDVVECMAF